ncbi:cytochrome P450 [Actinoplanes sp. NPDC026623]|uniref:cytochrome P450 n=1 Tax=Actinoplanes sp. NPDC026623 TaxID=3155610 RepID=UPI0033F998AB
MTAQYIPGPRGRWFVGDVINYERDRIGWLRENRSRYGDVVRLGPRTIAVHDVAAAHRILAATNDSFLIDAGFRGDAREQAALQAHVEDWMRVRREVWRSVGDRVTHLHLTRFLNAMSGEVRRHAGRPIDVLSTARGILGRAIVDFCVGGATPEAIRNELYESADGLFQTALHALVNGEGRVPWLPRPAARAATVANGRLLAQLAGVVEQRTRAAAPGSPRDLLDALIADRQGPGPGRVVSILRTIMFASHGVPGTAMAWVALLLAAHPSVTDRIAEEAAGLRTDDPTSARALPYTTAVIREVLRLYPPQWLLTRTTTRPTDILGHRVPAGCEILICPYLIHRDRRWWEEPETFSPDRWLRPGQPHARHAYLPFGSGTRFCPGSHLAMVQLVAMTAVLARDYALDLPPVESIEASCAGLLAPARLPGRWTAA